MNINVVVEGASDVEAARAIIRAAGMQPGKVVDKKGKSNLDPDIHKYNKAALFEPWVVFRDTDSHCPVELRGSLLESVADPSPGFRLRLAHSMTEAWLLADRSGFAAFFSVAEAKIARDPEALPHAKQEVLRLCEQSRSREIRYSMVAGQGQTGPLYVQKINEFAREHWNVPAAAETSESLRRALASISAL